MINTAQSDRSAYISLFIVVVLWGSSFAVSKIGLQELSPLNMAGIRFALASILFGILLAAQKSSSSLESKDILSFVVAGFMSITSYFYIQYTGLLYTTSINAALLLATSPIWTTIYCVVTKQERITSKAFIGILLAFTGICLVISKGKVFFLFASETLPGDLLLLLNSLVWAGFTLYGKKIMQKYSPFTAMAYIHIFGTIMLLPVILIPSNINPIPISQQLSGISFSTGVAILYLAGLCSVYGYGMWYRGVAQIGAVRTASFYYMSPLFALIAGVWLLDESFNFLVVVGGCLVMLGVYFVNKYKALIKSGN
jgi:drug/metabolite transporter (DMT)-like permease